MQPATSVDPHGLGWLVGSTAARCGRPREAAGSWCGIWFGALIRSSGWRWAGCHILAASSAGSRACPPGRCWLRLVRRWPGSAAAMGPLGLADFRLMSGAEQLGVPEPSTRRALLELALMVAILLVVLILGLVGIMAGAGNR